MQLIDMLSGQDVSSFLENEIEKELHQRRFFSAAAAGKADSPCAADPALDSESKPDSTDAPEMDTSEEEYPPVSEILERAREFAGGTYEPSLPERLQISKLGSDKKRVIYVFPSADRMMLKAVHHCLARTELALSPNCLAFRPGFSIHGAFRSVIRRYRPEYACIRIDIKNYFNSIPVERMSHVSAECFSGEPGLAESIRKMLFNEQVLEKGLVIRDADKGIMAGMPLSPLLANLYLTEFDRKAETWAPVYARYSDDMIFFCEPMTAEALWRKIEEELSVYGLLRNEDKSSVIPPGEEWEFLGLSFRDGRIGLSSGSIQKMKGKISRAARKLYRWKIRKGASTERAARALIRKFQFKFYGTGTEDDELTWSRWYFPLISGAEDLRKIDIYLQEMIRYLDSGRHTKKNYKRLPYAELKKLGYIPLVAAFYALREDNKKDTSEETRKWTYRWRSKRIFGG